MVVCEKHQDSADILAQLLDAVQQMRTCLQGSHADELDGLILEVWRVWCGSHCSSMSHWAWFLTRATKNPWKLVHLEDRNEVLSLRSSTTDDAKTGKLVLVGEPNLQRDCALDLAKRRPVVRRQAPTTQVRIEPNPPVIELEYSL